VYAVEASDMATKTRQVVAANGLSDTITVLHCRVEDAELPEKVDVVVSEWMGMALFFESVSRQQSHWTYPYLCDGACKGVFGGVQHYSVLPTSFAPLLSALRRAS
jgi:hypothetical protein